ncbi:hypothetical protein Leryth_013467 [Lithospermum erythrorhizon]|nr:hypothetical protein Leryth_013467 [Lithospermum erythrorhizon]
MSSGESDDLIHNYKLPTFCLCKNHFHLELTFIVQTKKEFLKIEYNSQKSPFNGPCGGLKCADKQTNSYSYTNANFKDYPNSYPHASIKPRKFATFQVLCTVPVQAVAVLFRKQDKHMKNE